MPRAFSKTSKRGDSGFRLGFVERNHLAADFLKQAIKERKGRFSEQCPEDDARLQERDRGKLTVAGLIHGRSQG